jgi:hypothetical protein
MRSYGASPINTLTRRKGEKFPMPGPDAALNAYAIGIRWPHALRKALESAAAARSQSVAGFVEGVVLALVAAGLIEQPKTE